MFLTLCFYLVFRFFLSKTFCFDFLKIVGFSIAVFCWNFFVFRLKTYFALILWFKQIFLLNILLIWEVLGSPVTKNLFYNHTFSESHHLYFYKINHYSIHAIVNHQAVRMFQLQDIGVSCWSRSIMYLFRAKQSFKQYF